jgi:hypothetical protein
VKCESYADQQSKRDVLKGTCVEISDIQLCVVLSFTVELFGHWRCHQTKVPVAVKASQLISS